MKHSVNKFLLLTIPSASNCDPSLPAEPPVSPSEADVQSRTALSKIPKFSPFSKIKSFISSAAVSNPLTRVKGHSGGEGVYELRVDPLDEKDLIRTPDREEFERSFRPPSSSPTGRVTKHILRTLWTVLRCPSI